VGQKAEEWTPHHSFSLNPSSCSLLSHAHLFFQACLFSNAGNPDWTGPGFDCYLQLQTIWAFSPGKSEKVEEYK
jgi:hypothetical protein